MSEIQVPKFPESVSEGTVATWHKQEGDSVAIDEVIVEIETDKVVMEVPASADGVIEKIIKHEGDAVTSEEVIGTLGDGSSAASASATEAASEPASDPEAAPAEPAPGSDKGEQVELKTPAFPESISEGTIATWHKQPGESVTADEVLVEIETDKVMMEVPATCSGTLVSQTRTEGDTVTSEEVIGMLGTAADAAASTETDKPDSASTSEAPADSKQHDLSPAARRAAREHNVSDLDNIQGSGKDGRITKKDIEAHTRQSQATPAPGPAPTSSAETAAAPAPETEGGERPEKRVRMTRLRQTVAKRLLEVQQTNAILTTFNEVDMQPVMDLRNRYKDAFVNTHGTKLGFMSFFLKAATEALKQFPEVNASIDGNDIVYHGYFDIGVAVGSDRGLVVPVIRNTDTRSFADIEGEIVDMAKRARDGKIGLEEMQGGTFTVTNGGTYGSMLSTPIINAPQSAILGMHNIVERPWVVNGEIKIRPIMYLALSYDHRIIDGSVSVRFLKMIKELVEDPSRMLLQV